MNASPLIRAILRLELGKADCSRRRVAAVLVNDGWVCGVGHNTLPEGSCIGGDCPRGRMSYEEQPADVGYEKSGCTSTHAEAMAISQAGALARGSIAYVTEWPCPGCAALLEKAGITKVIKVEVQK